MPGLGTLVQLRLAPDTAAAVAVYKPVTFGVADRTCLDQWVDHLDACQVPHAAIAARRIGD